MQVTINGENRTFDAPMSLSALVQALQLDICQVAIELNRAIAPRSRYDDVTVKDGDSIEIVEFIGGG